MTSDTTQDGESAPFEVVRRRAMRTGPPPYQGASALRQTPAVVLDVLVHLLAGVIVGTAAAGSLGFGPGLVVGYVVVSFVHRVLLRRWWGATIGGALFGLRWIDTGTGRKPTLGWLAAAWFIRSLATVLTVLPGF
ncbi:MAG: putative rane protein [Amycolatopsis sp.]|uniref:RDD family protein n=1 Tax=Amycolatopsis sp. TaxID=37632 RepID=UPI002619FF5F|nr:RDD family protein [Amycolatopsis sp.]MCU1681520.1 putative rane protein [Amycolatopsis sp.]